MASALPLLLVGGAALLLMGKKKNGAAATTAPATKPATKPASTTPSPPEEPLETCGVNASYAESYRGIPLYEGFGYILEELAEEGWHHENFLVSVCPPPDFEKKTIGADRQSAERAMQKAKLFIDQKPEEARELAGLS